jgi:hypothetical protein
LSEGSAEPQRLDLGHKTPDDRNVYAKVPAKAPIFAIATHESAAFEKKPFDLRDRSVLHLVRDQVKGIDIKGPKGLLSATKDEKGDWNITKPLATKGAKWGVDGVLIALENMLFEGLAAEEAADLAPYGLDKPTYTVLLHMADGTAKKLEVGDKVPEDKKSLVIASEAFTPEKYYARDTARDMVGIIATTAPDELAKAETSMRSKMLLDFPALEVTKIELTLDGQTRVYTRSVTKGPAGLDIRTWKQTSPSVKDLDTKTVEDLLFEAASTDVDQFIDSPGPPTAYGLHAPAVRVALEFENKLPAWFEIAVKDGVAYARRDHDVSVLKLAAKGISIAESFKTKL